MSKILALSGGVGGAKLVLGLTRILAPDELTVCANTGDDFTHCGLRICPDLDTVMYTLAGISNIEQGWGLAGETWQFMDRLRALGGADWFALGDRDLATHVLRTEQLAAGQSLTAVTRQMALRLGVLHPLLPMSDDEVSTVVETAEGELAFQEYFVRRRCEPVVRGCHFRGAARARPQPDLMALLGDPSLTAVIICPSNPFLSIAPLLGLPALREALAASPAPVIAVSPIVGGAALKGPAAKMMRELELPVSAAAVAQYYGTLLDGFVVDEKDRAQASLLEAEGTPCLVTATVMRTANDKQRLAEDVLAFAHQLHD